MMTIRSPVASATTVTWCGRVPLSVRVVALPLSSRATKRQSKISKRIDLSTVLTGKYGLVDAQALLTEQVIAILLDSGQSRSR